jgi:two-component system OmpR family sensor kinase
MHSLQRTLSLRYAATMLTALLLVGLWAYLGVRTTLERELDQELASAAALMVDAIAVGEPLTAHAAAGDPRDSLISGRRLVVTRDSNGRILGSNTPMLAELPLDSAALTLARAGQQGWSMTEWAGRDLRSVYVPGPPRIRGEPSNVAVVELAAPVSPLFHASRDVLLRMLATALLGTAITWLGAAWLARSSLEPVAEIAAQARSIRSNGSQQQITVHADVIELQDLIGVLNGMLSRLDAALAEQRRIIRDVGHELRTPITAMRGEIEVALRRERRPEEYRVLLGSILEEVDRLALIGDQLITLTRYEAGDLAVNYKRVEPAALIPEVLGSARRRLAAHRVRIGSVPPGLACDLDPYLVSLALAQLLENVVRHTPAGTEVVIGAGSHDGTVTITVEDSGPGADPEQLPQLFAPFFQLDPARTRGAGVGLGLALVAAIVRLHGGTATADRSPLGGLRVTLAFPKNLPPLVA